MKKVFAKTAVVFVIVCFFADIYANLLFDDGVPEDLRNGISELYRKKNIKNSFLIEVHANGDLLIIAENGFVKSLSMTDITVFDVLNVMEEMVEIVFEKKGPEKISVETGKDLKKVRKFSPDEKELKKDEEHKYLKGGIKVADNIEFFPWTPGSERFNVSLFVTSEENWAGGAGISAGLAFLRLGITFKKGADIVFAKSDKVPWESYGANIQFDVFSAYGSFVSIGFEVALYRAMEKLFEREFFVFKTGYRYKWFEIAASINVSPSVVELGLFGTKYTMERYNFVISGGVLF
jgi:hypothetical protein